jgi:hypothetical protein
LLLPLLGYVHEHIRWCRLYDGSASISEHIHFSHIFQPSNSLPGQTISTSTDVLKKKIPYQRKEQEQLVVKDGKVAQNDSQAHNVN